MSRRISILRAILLTAALLVPATSASAVCREDLVASAQTLKRTREGMESAAKGNAAAQCAAFRQHVAALTKVRGVFARCDSGADKAKNDAQVGETIAVVTRQAQQACKK
jgi:hypothetical protein